MHGKFECKIWNPSQPKLLTFNFEFTIWIIFKHLIKVYKKLNNDITTIITIIVAAYMSFYKIILSKCQTF